MKIAIHDFAGHQFQTLLSAELARRGHDVTHLYFAEDPGPKASFNSEVIRGLCFKAVSIGVPYSKQSFVKRLYLDLRYRCRIREALAGSEFDIVISSNCPTWVQGAVMRASAERAGSRFYYWCQDFYGIAVGSIFSRKLGFIGDLAGRLLVHWDLAHMRASEGVIHITEDFRRLTDAAGVSADKTHVIHNWGALDDIPLRGKNTHWSRAHGLDPVNLRVVYSGTLGLKHNPDLLIQAAIKSPEVEFVVVAAGAGVERLSAAGIKNIVVLPLQDFKDLSSALGSADVLIAVIEKEAGTFSVPSKILSYLCAGKPIVLASPSDNLAARTIVSAGAGIVVDSDDAEGFANSISRLVSSPQERQEMGASARHFAEKHFCIADIADQFELIFAKSK